MAQERPLNQSVDTPSHRTEALHRFPMTWTAWGITLAAVLAAALIKPAERFYYDSLNYWELGDTFIRHGDFSLLNFSSPLRGYLLPLVDHGLRALSGALTWGSSTSVRIFNALIFSLIAAVLGPRFATISWPGRRWGLGRRLALSALLILFWSGYLNFPLSDFAALLFVLVALAATARSDVPVWMLIGGLATGIAINMRPSYVPLLGIIPVLSGWTWLQKHHWKARSIKRFTLPMTLLVLGWGLISLPQSLGAHRHFGTWSFVPGSPAHLESLQLTEGLRLQRYETFVGMGHGPQMLYEDPTGRQLLSEQPHEFVSGIEQYLELVVHHPISMAGLMVRHVVNGFDQRYSTPYIEHLDAGSHRWMRIGGFVLIFLGLLRVLWRPARHSLGSARWRYPTALLICCLTSVPSAMETRFLLPAYILSYILVLAPGWPTPIVAGQRGFRRYRTAGAILVAYIIFMAVVWHVTGGASAHLRFG